MYAQVFGFSLFQWTFVSEVSGFKKIAMKWSSDPHMKDVFSFQQVGSLRLLLKLSVIKGGFF